MVSFARPMSRSRRFLEALKRNLAPSEPEPFADRVKRQAPTVRQLIQNDAPPTVTLPRHQVVMLRHGFAELLKLAISERDCFYQSNTDGEGNVLDREDRITLDEMDAEIDRAQYTLREFDRIYPNA